MTLPLPVDEAADELLTIAMICRRYGVTRDALNYAYGAGHLRAAENRSGTPRFRAAEVEHWLAESHAKRTQSSTARYPTRDG